MRDAAKTPCVGMDGLVTVCPPQEGNDALPPLEVAACMIAAGAGARVLLLLDVNVPPKRGVSAANVLQRLDLGLTWDPNEAEDWVAKTRFAAICAPGMIPARSRTCATCVATSVCARRSRRSSSCSRPQSSSVVLGARPGPVLGTAVEVMQTLGHPSGMAIQGIEGGVVPTLRKRSRGIHLDGCHQVPITIEPADFGLSCDHDAELPMFGPPDEGFGTADNPEIVRAACEENQAVLAGQHGVARSHALLTAAILLRTLGLAPTIADGVAKATESLDSGAASEVLVRLRDVARR